MTDHSSIVRQGISEYELKLQSEIADQFKKFMGLSQRVANVPGREGELITEENADELSDEWSRNRLSAFGPTQDALTLILAHAVFEALLIDLTVSAVLGVSDDFIRSNYPGRKVSLQEINESSIEQVVKQKLAKDCYRKLEQNEVIDLLVAMCQKSNSSVCQDIHDVYQPNRGAIEAIDKTRQDILHKVEWDPSY